MAEQKNIQEQDINQLLKVRREKLADLISCNIRLDVAF